MSLMLISVTAIGMLPIRLKSWWCRLAEAVLALDEERQLFFRRLAAEDGVAVRKAAKPLDDFDVQPGHVTIGRAAGHRRYGHHQIEAALLVGDVFAVLERQIKEQAPSG